VSLLLRLGLVDRLDDTDSDSLTHVADGKAPEWRVLLEILNAHGLGGNESGHDGITLLNHLRGLLEHLAVTLVDLLVKLGKFAGNVRSVAIEHGRIASVDLTGWLRMIT